MSMATAASGFGRTDFTPAEQDRIQRALSDKLGNDKLQRRKGPGGQQLIYVESWQAIELANELFGYNGWSCSVMQLATDYVSVESSKGCGFCSASHADRTKRRQVFSWY